MIASLPDSGRPLIPGIEASEEETETEDPDLEPGEELEEQDFATDDDPMLNAGIPGGEAEGVLEEDEA